MGHERTELFLYTPLPCPLQDGDLVSFVVFVVARVRGRTTIIIVSKHVLFHHNIDGSLSPSSICPTKPYSSVYCIWHVLVASYKGYTKKTTIFHHLHMDQTVCM